jgi:hypothetical protein
VTLRPGREELAGYLRSRSTWRMQGKDVRVNDVDLDRLKEAADELLRCPHEGCAYCFTAEKEAG